MVKVFVDGPDRLCANCKPNITKMIKLPYLEDVFQCPTCFGFQYITPDIQTDDEEEEYSGPGAL